MKAALKSLVSKALRAEARAVLRRFKPRVVAVTGNVGKTSTKDAVFAAVAGSFHARKSEKSFNSDIGLPLAILGLDNAWSSPVGWAKNIWLGALTAFGPAREGSFPELLILEVGADHPGDIKSVAPWLSPDITVLTRMSDTPVHVEYFKDSAEVLDEKMSLARATKEGGTIVVNADDPLFMEAVKGLGMKLVTYGEGADADVRIMSSETAYDGNPLALPTGQDIVVSVGPESLKMTLAGVIGRHLAYPVAAAVAVSQALGVSLTEAEKALNHFDTPRGRMRLLPGKEHSAVIDDTYNSSPIAAMEALKSLDNVFSRGRKIAVLADMKELGEHSDRAHREIGMYAGRVAHTLVTVGEGGKMIASGAREAKLFPDRIFEFDNSVDAAAALADMVRAGDVVLVKGSQSMRMERVSKALLADPDDAARLLVRQEKEWDKR